jgi:hypothetical protein
LVAITKDLDYLSITIDDLHEEKNDILAQLEQEKVYFCFGFDLPLKDDKVS